MATTRTGIAWCDRTWNPTRGCRPISPGCKNCYAERQAYRFSGAGQPYEGLVALGKNGPRWTGAGRLIVSAIEEPLRWRTPARVFVDSMSDLFFEDFTFEEIAAVFGVMSAAKRHTFQVLTKRPARLREWFRWLDEQDVPPDDIVETCAANYVDIDQVGSPWPLPNVWLGVSVEDQKHADERIPDLIAAPAAVRFVSYEPALGPVDFVGTPDEPGIVFSRRAVQSRVDYGTGTEWDLDVQSEIDWIIVGGESGPGARPFDVAWAESTVQQCRDAGIAAFVKQLGSRPFRSSQSGGTTPYDVVLDDSKGADPAEWAEHLRVQEFPAVLGAAEVVW